LLAPATEAVMAGGESWVYSRIYRWDGRRWAEVLTPEGQRLCHLWGQAPNDFWAVGNSGAIHWDGSTWSNHLAGSLLFRVWGSSSSDVWAAGWSGLFHFDGTGWAKVQPTVANAPQKYFTVQGSGPGDVWVGGEGALLRFDGKRWRTAAEHLTINALWVAGDNEAWVSAKPQGGSGWAIFRWNGRALELSLNPAMVVDFWGPAANDLWAVGEGGLLAHWDGHAWARRDSGTTRYLHGVWGSDARDVWVVGEDGRMRHFDGNEWSTRAAPQAQRFRSIWGTTPDRVYATTLAYQERKTIQ
jgi:hypothetical protein